MFDLFRTATPFRQTKTLVASLPKLIGKNTTYKNSWTYWAFLISSDVISGTEYAPGPDNTNHTLIWGKAGYKCLRHFQILQKQQQHETSRQKFATFTTSLHRLIIHLLCPSNFAFTIFTETIMHLVFTPHLPLREKIKKNQIT